LRRQTILDAALSVFAESGFEAARLDEIAARAGVAKGTLYLYFHNKQALFEELVRSAVLPLMDKLSQAAADPDLSPSAVFDAFFRLFQKEILGTPRKQLLRLIIAEGPRFPALARFYHREVVMRGLRLMQSLARRAHRQHEFPSDAAARFPHLIVAPLLLAIVWDGLFARLDPLNVPGLLRAHKAVLTGKGGGVTV
jgi:AcrR family transcriptional regulator